MFKEKQLRGLVQVLKGDIARAGVEKLEWKAEKEM